MSLITNIKWQIDKRAKQKYILKLRILYAYLLLSAQYKSLIFTEAQFTISSWM